MAILPRYSLNSTSVLVSGNELQLVTIGWSLSESVVVINKKRCSTQVKVYLPMLMMVSTILL